MIRALKLLMRHSRIAAAMWGALVATSSMAAEPAAGKPVAGDPVVAGHSAVSVEAPPPTADLAAFPQIRELGAGDRRMFVVDHGDTWSMHAESVVTDAMFELWKEAGGPDYVAKVLVNRPYTISVHRLPAARIVDRLLEGYGYTLHYDPSGRLSKVRVYSPQPAQMFKTPRLVESLASWKEAELPPLADSTAPPPIPPAPATAAPAPPPGAAPATLENLSAH